MTPTPTTAADVRAELERIHLTPVIEGRTLVVPTSLPDSFLRALHILHTGVRAILQRQPWYGCSTTTGWCISLDPNERIPGWIGLLCVAGDTTWHRLPVLPADERARFFTAATEPKTSERVVQFRSHVRTTADKRRTPERVLA